MESKKLFGISALILAVAGCEPIKEEVNIADTYKPKLIQQVERTEQATSQLEGRIVKVQTSSLSYRVKYDSSDNVRAGNHEFEYVIITDKEGRTHTLIYPYSKAILEGKAIIQYRDLPLRVMSTDDFIDTYINKLFDTDDYFFLETDGFILKDGIKYQGDK